MNLIQYYGMKIPCYRFIEQYVIVSFRDSFHWCETTNIFFGIVLIKSYLFYKFEFLEQNH